MSIIDRVNALGLPDGEYVVIGSGLLDAYGLRAARDVDLVVSDALFQALASDARYRSEKNDRGVQFLTRRDGDAVEVWRDWFPDAPFSVLNASAVTVDGVAFAAPEIIIQRKKQRGSQKDMADIALLEGYCHER